MLFSKPGEYEACGMFTKGHITLLLLTIIGIIVALKNTANKTKKEVKQIIKRCTIYRNSLNSYWENCYICNILRSIVYKLN